MSIFLLFILAFMALPVIKLVSSALTAQATQTFSFENFEKIFTSAYYAQSFGNSLKLSLQCSVFGIIIALFCSYAITRFVSERTQNNLLVIVNMTSNFAGLPLGFALTLMLALPAFSLSCCNRWASTSPKTFRSILCRAW